jgi:hypothetical protein
MKKHMIALIFLILVYLIGYIFVRQTHAEIWEKDGKTYVIFPKNKILYYLYRPLSVIDAKITDTQTHIGQHR